MACKKIKLRKERVVNLNAKTIRKLADKGLTIGQFKKRYSIK